MNEEELRNRAQRILSAYDYSIYKLSNGNASYRAKINKQINQNTTISAETILLILHTFPDVSAEWLLRGVGEMMKKEHAGTTINLAKAEGGHANAGGTQTISASADEVSALKKRISELEQDKANMQKLIDKLS